jgi:hypothetical protein
MEPTALFRLAAFFVRCQLKKHCMPVTYRIQVLMAFFLLPFYNSVVYFSNSISYLISNFFFLNSVQAISKQNLKTINFNTNAII